MHAQVKRWVKLITHQKPMYVHFARNRVRSPKPRVYTPPVANTHPQRGAFARRGIPYAIMEHRDLAAG
jgi:hypothetical protein